ncbi:ComEC/Rec2 family competence protein [Martelella mediterranea]|uniref:ComEC family competence protein n=1 Tax=Martelella mediterranea DSM 17316 TaxID=1122214 RepID=A0A1U9Z456_9HYPH|nr:ComEC/Rec2 family competence protein [Martelella mediterranea]AQZ52479.1 ComEC family competence protein [Martelella mediterranea DSM 17316]
MRGSGAGTSEIDGAESRRAVPARFRAAFRKRQPKGEREADFYQRDAGRAGRFDIAALWREEQAFGRPFLMVPVALAAGIGWWFSLAESPSSLGLGIYGGLAVFAAVLLRNGRGLLPVASACIALFLCGALLAELETARRATVMLDSAVTTHITGVVESREPTETGWRYLVQVTATDDPVIHRPPERVTLVARGNLPPVGIGHAIQGLGRLLPPSAPVMPGLVDFGFLSYFDGIGAVGFFYGPPADIGVAPAPGLNARAGFAIERIRDGIAGRTRAVLAGDTGAFANAIITGERRALSDDMLDALRNAGLAHIIAISGLHMALAAGIFFSSLRLLLALSPRAAEAVSTKKIAAAAAIAAALFYLLISGMQVSAERAFIMLAVMLAAAIFDRPAISLRNVALAALVILIVTPAEVVGPGMQMSFAATLALIAGYGAWQRRPAEGFRQSRGPLRWLWIAASGIVLTALIGGLSTTPFAIHHFSRIAGYGLLGNLLAMPVVTFIVMPAGLLSLIAMPLNLHAPFLFVMGWGLDWVMRAATWVDGLGGAFTTGRAPEGFLLLFLAGFLPLVLLRTRLRLLGVIPMAVSVALISWPREPSPSQILVADDGNLVAFVTGDVAALTTKRPPSFVFEQWETALALAETLPPVEESALVLDEEDRFARLEAADMASAARALRDTITEAGRTPGIFHCKKDAWCYGLFMELRLMTVDRPAFAGLACDNADIVVSRYRPGFQICRSGAYLVTPAMRRQHGAFQFTLPPTASRTRDDGDIRRSVAEPDRGEAIVQQASNANPLRVGKADAAAPPSTPSQSPCGPMTLSISTSVRALTRPWNRHRLYDWRSGEYLPVIAVPETLTFSGNGGSGRPACPAP